MKFKFSFLREKIDWKLILPAFGLTLFGLIIIYTTSLYSHNFSNFKKQLIFFLISIIFLFVLSFFDLRFLKTNSYLIFSLYVAALCLLFGLLIFGKELRGVRGWYRIGPFSFDPVPFSVVLVGIVLSKYFATRHIQIHNLKLIFFSFLYAFFPSFLVILQPDLGSGLIFIFVWLGILLFSGIKLSHLVIIGLIFLIIFFVGWQFWMKDYQKQRILSFLNPQKDKKGVSWQINQSKIAIGSGGIFGKGLGKGSQTQYGFLPEAQTDFIFSAIAEQTGLLGVSVLLSLYFFLLWRILKIIAFAKSNFLRLFAAGFSFLLISQSFINMGMTLGILPIIGIPLPFVSYGGSQLLAFYLGLGILQNLEKE